MKRQLLLSVLISALLMQKVSGQTSDTLLNKILAVQESIYIGKPLDSIINALPPGYIQMRIVADGRSRITARKLRIKYPNRIFVDLHVKEYLNMNPVDEARVWNMTLMRKEKLYITVINKKTDCYRNCEVY